MKNSSESNLIFAPTVSHPPKLKFRIYHFPCPSNLDDRVFRKAVTRSIKRLHVKCLYVRNVAYWNADGQLFCAVQASTDLPLQLFHRYIQLFSY